MLVLIDMNLSPEWAPILAAGGLDAVHWSSIGSASAADSILFEWARKEGAVLLTQDLDFPQLLFALQSSKPSVVLLRGMNELAEEDRLRVCATLRQAESKLSEGVLMVIDPLRVRYRILPL